MPLVKIYAPYRLEVHYARNRYYLLQKRHIWAQTSNNNSTIVRMYCLVESVYRALEDYTNISNMVDIYILM